MKPEKVYSMLTEKSISINDIPGGLPEFTPEDARHALGGMKPCEFNYCQFVFLLYDEKHNDLVSNVLFHYEKENKIKPDDKENITKIARLACAAQRKSDGRLLDKELYLCCQFTKNSWRHKWKDIYYLMNAYLNELRSNVSWHIYKKTQE